MSHEHGSGAAADYLRSVLPGGPRIAVVLGSGLSHLAELLDDSVSVAFDDVPGLPRSTVEGHAGRFVCGSLDGVEVILQAGRYHAYEGYPMEVVVAPVRILAALGVDTIVFTNAAGGIGPNTAPGDLVLIDDHINLMFRSPLSGPVAPGEERFPDMSAPYDVELQERVRRAAARYGAALERGTYAAVLGPSYETAAEVRMLRTLGADVVGMSTVPEVITARALGVRCAAISMVTNKATGLSAEEISHADVLEIGRDAGQRLGDVIVGLVASLGGERADDASRAAAAPQSTGAK